MTPRHPDAKHSSFAPTGHDVTPPATSSSGKAVSRLLEAEDIVNYLGVRTDWVYREVRAGRLPHIRLGRAVRFRSESIEAWIDSRERGVPGRRRP